MENGQIQAVVAWHPDRLHRSPRELERFIDLAESTRLRVETVQAGDLDLSTPSGRAVARTLGAWARYESEHKSDRITRKLEQNAKEGKHHGGPRPYGYNDDRKTINRREAKVIRECVERILAGETFGTLLKDLNRRGLTTSTGKPWTHVTLRGVLVRARNAGLREHKGEVIGKAEWAAIVDRDTWEAFRREVDRPDRITTPGRAGRVHLLSTIGHCAICGGKLMVAKSKGKNGQPGWSVYRCRTGCTSRHQARLDAFVTDLVLSYLRTRTLDELFPPDREADQDRRKARAEAERARRKLAEVRAAYDNDRIDLADLVGLPRPVDEAARRCGALRRAASG